MNFAQPSYLLLLGIIIPLALMLLAWVARNQKTAIKRLGDPSLVNRLTTTINWTGRKWKNLLWLMATFFLLLSLARPQWGNEVREVDQKGLQIIVALDVSQSMLADDVKPSRLDRAKLEITDLVSKLNGDEIGLVLFSGASFIQVPLTSDYNTALTYLENAQPGVISRPGTVIGDAIRTAVSGFDTRLNSQKVLIIMTDGEDSETSPLEAAQEAKEQDVMIYTFGFGTPDGQPVPVTDDQGNVLGYKQDQYGNMVISKLDEDTLQTIAVIGNGKYYRATASGKELGNLLEEINTLQKTQLQSIFENRAIERFQIFLLLAFLFLVTAELLSERRRGGYFIPWLSNGNSASIQQKNLKPRN